MSDEKHLPRGWMGLILAILAAADQLRRLRKPDERQ